MRRFSGLHYPRITKKERELEVETKKSTGKTIIHRTTLKHMIPTKQALKSLIKNSIKTSNDNNKKV